MQLSSQSSPIPLVLRRKFNPEILTPDRGVEQGWGGENKLFSSFLRRYLENGIRDTTTVITNDYIGRCMRFRLSTGTKFVDLG